MTNKTLKITTLNINRIKQQFKVLTLQDWIRKENPDIFFLQEVTTHECTAWFAKYDCVVNLGDRCYGVATFWKKELKAKEISRLVDGRGLSVLIDKLLFINIYVPAGAKNTENRKLFFNVNVTPLFNSNNRGIIFAGDFNCVISQLDQTPGFNKCVQLEHLIKGLNLKDAWRVTDKNKKMYTFNACRFSSRLDRIYVSQELCTNISKSYISPIAISDHVGFSAEIKDCMCRNEEYQICVNKTWKLNTSILNREDVIKKLNELCVSCLEKEKDFKDTITWWTKYTKPLIIRFCRTQSESIEKWRKSTMEYYNIVFSDMVSENIKCGKYKEEIKEIKEEIIKLQERSLEGLKIRAKSGINFSSEKAGIYQVMKQYKSGKRQKIKLIKDEITNNTYTDEEDILNVFYDHFSEAFNNTSEDQINDTEMLYFIQNNLRQISKNDEAEFKELGRPLIEKEVFQVIQSGKNNKSPGSDGLPIEIYKVLWPLLGKAFTRMYNDVLIKGFPEEEQCTGIVNLLQKINNPKYVKDFRAVTLLNTDYKIFSGCMASRLKPVMDKIIDPVQTCSVPGKKISDTLNEVITASHYIFSKEKLGAILTIDFKAAFDRVYHKYMWLVLKENKIDERLINALKFLYKNATSQIKVNGKLTKQFKIKRSVRQGCPSSMALFCITIQPFINLLLKKLKGINIYNSVFKIASFADDLTVAITKKEELNTVKNCIDKYCSFSGAEINKKKCELIRAKQNKDIYNADWLTEKDHVKILGITIGKTFAQTQTKTWDQINLKIMNILYENKWRNISLLEKVEFIQTFALSKMWYVASVLPIKTCMEQKIMKHINFFLWSGDIFRIAKEKCYLPPEKGGIGLIHLKAKCDALLFLSAERAIAGKGSKSLEAMLKYYKNIHGESLPYWPNVVKLNTGISYMLGLVLYGKNYEEENLTCKDIYKQNMEALGYGEKVVVTAPGSINIEHARNVCWANVYDCINFKLVDKSIRSTWIKIAHNIYATKVRRKNIGLTNDDTCDICGERDTLFHRLTTCGIAKDTVQWVFDKIDKIANKRNTVTLGHLLYGDLSEIRPPELRNSVLWLLCHLVDSLIGRYKVHSLNCFKIYIKYRWLHCKNKNKIKNELGNALDELIN